MAQINTTSVNQMIEVARYVANELKPGDVILLVGPLASGKTYFVKALAQELGCSDNVTSPTYAIVNFYNTKIGDLIHIDTYRISSLPEFFDLGVDEFIHESITAIEWGDKVQEAFSEYLLIRLTIVNIEINHRRIDFSCSGGRWNDFLTHLKEKYH